jgi:manganese oxidase
MKKVLCNLAKGNELSRAARIVRLFSLTVFSLLSGCNPVDNSKPQPSTSGNDNVTECRNTVKASVVALEQVYYYNRFGALNPQGLMYALERDVVYSYEEDEDKRNDGKTNVEDKSIALKHDESDFKYAGHVQLRGGKRPRPLVLRVNEGDCLEVTFTNLLAPTGNGQEIFDDPLTHTNKDPATRAKLAIDPEEPKTRLASMHVNGLDYVSQTGKPADGMASDGANIGLNPSSLVASGHTTVYKWYAKKEGGYLFYSMAHPSGGEGDGGQLGLGLFGSINVEPAGSTWYRSQVTHDELMAAKNGDSQLGATKYPKFDYTKLRILDKDLGGNGDTAEILHSDLNAVIKVGKYDKNHPEKGGESCDQERGHDKSCGQPFREFTAIFHDEITALQAYPELDEGGKLEKVKDGMAINYGASGMGSAVLARRKYDPQSDNPGVLCPECKAEEFFLSSWANGDPALLPEYKDDPSNVHHSYMGDNVRFRNLHAGPKETHVFHLHAHQWVRDKNDPQSVYLDSQTISPGASFSYEVHYGGSGNRNFTPGDSIFHCHLYPHFAQGMWELWRTHDVFEDGTYTEDKTKPQDGINSRNLPDYKIAEGTPNPALVPIPGTALPPMPTPEFPGYPFYIAGEKGHRPPQPPLDFAKENGKELNGGLPRHLVLAGSVEDGSKAVETLYNKKAGWNCDDLYGCGREKSSKIASSVHELNGDDDHYVFARKIKSARIEILDNNNERVKKEQKAMAFHEGKLPNSVKLDRPQGKDAAHNWPPHEWPKHDLVPVGYPTCNADGKCDDLNEKDPDKRIVFHVNGLKPQSGAPYADPCLTTQSNVEPAMRVYKAAYIQFDMTVNKHGWHDPQARIPVLEEDVLSTLNGKRAPEPLFFRANSGECVEFHATNLIPSNINLDDFQYFTPTDTMGQHIHLVKFDVTSSDGSGNGWNYEDGTFSPDEVRERIIANNQWVAECTKGQHPEGCKNVNNLAPVAHQLFTAGALKNDPKSKVRGSCNGFNALNPFDPLYKKHLEAWEKKHPWCGAQTTVQRWWADPLKSSFYRDASLNFKPCEEAKTETEKQTCDDRTIRTVFTHDHFGPSSHQQHGFYAALVVEPDNSLWQHLDGKVMGGEKWENGGFKNALPEGNRHDGGPTSYAANILVPKRDAKGSCSGEHMENCSKDRTSREFGLAFADFATIYTGKPKPGIPDTPVNPPNRKEEELPRAISFKKMPEPEAIAASDPGTQLINYRNEPIPLRISECAADGTQQQCRQYKQKQGEAGNMANVFSSLLHENKSPNPSLKYPSHEKDRSGLAGGMREPGDPATPLLPAFEGDHIQLRLIQGAQEEQHVFTMHGVQWHEQPDSPNSGWTNAQQIGISEHFEFNTSLFKDGRISDYLYYSSATDNLWDGMWGLLRAYPKCVKGDKNRCLAINKAPEFKAWGLKNLSPLPTNLPDELAVSRPGTSVCPESRIPVTFDLEAKNNQNIVYNSRYGIGDSNGIKIENTGIAEAAKINEPLVLRVAAGDCVKISLKNSFDPKIKDGLANPQSWSWNMMSPIVDSLNFNQISMSDKVRLQPQLLFNFVNLAEPEVGINAKKEEGKHDGFKAVSPGGEKAQLWYAGLDKFDFAATDPNQHHPEKPVEFGVVGLTDMGDVIKHSSHGAVGALVVEPEDTVSDETCGDNKKQYVKTTQLMKDICRKDAKPRPDGQKVPLFREFVVIYQDDLSLQQGGLPLPNLRAADDAEDTGQKAFSYGAEPLWARVGAGSPAIEPDVLMNYDLANVFSSIKHGNTCAFNGLADTLKSGTSQPRTCDPSTPVFVAKKGMPVRFRVVHPGGHPRQHAFTLFGHHWDHNPWNNDSSALCSPYEQYDEGSKCLQKINGKLLSSKSPSSNWVDTEGGIGPGRHLNILTIAGGDAGIPGDYMYRTQEGFMFSGGLWGIFRVCDSDPADDGLCPDFKTDNSLAAVTNR